MTKGRGSSVLKRLVCSHVDNIKESSNNEGKKGKKISLYYRLRCNKLRGVLRSLMETCSYLYSLENHFSHVSKYILQLWPDTSPMYPAMPDTSPMYPAMPDTSPMYPAMPDTCFLYCERLDLYLCFGTPLSLNWVSSRARALHCFAHKLEPTVQSYSFSLSYRILHVY